MSKRKVTKKIKNNKTSAQREELKLKKKVDEAVDKAIHDFNDVFIKLGKE